MTTDRDSQLSWGGGDHLSINRPVVKFAVEEDVDVDANEEEVCSLYICCRFPIGWHLLLCEYLCTFIVCFFTFT